MILSFAAEDTMRKDVSQHKQIIGFDPFRLAVVTAIDDAVAMFGHQQMKDALVEIAVCLAESVLDRHILTHLPLPFTQTLALNTIDKNQFLTLLQSTAFDVTMCRNVDHFSLPGIHPLIESTAASTNPIIKIFFVIIVFFELLNVSSYGVPDVCIARSGESVEQGENSYERRNYRGC